MTANPPGGHEPPQRPGKAGTRAKIIAAARSLFAEKGFDGTSVRAIGHAAGVDASLVNHYFGGKEALFREIMEIPVDPAAIMAGVFSGAHDGDGGQLPRRLVEKFFSIWEGPETGPQMIALLRRALADPAQARPLQSFMTEGVLRPIAERLTTGSPAEVQLRLTLAGSHLIGAMVNRHVLRIEPLVQMPQREYIELTIPVVEHFLLGDAEVSSRHESKENL